MTATFSVDLGTSPQFVDFLDVAAGYGSLAVPITGLLPGDDVTAVSLAIQGTSLTTITATVDTVQRTQGYYEWTDDASIDARFTLTAAQVALIGAATSCTYSVVLTLTRSENSYQREVQSGNIGARGAWPSLPNIVSTVVISGGPALGTVGATAQLTATGYDAAGNVVAGVTFAWASSDTSRVTVGASTGLVAFVALGGAVVTATAYGASDTESATTISNFSAGALFYATSSTAISPLAIGTALQYLRVNSGATAPEWDTLTAADVGAGSFPSGAFTFPGAVTFGSTTTLNGIAYTWPASQGASRFLMTNGSGALTWQSPLEYLALGDLSDVTITSPASGQVLAYNGTVWVNTLSVGGLTATGLTVTKTGATAGLTLNAVSGQAGGVFFQQAGTDRWQIDTTTTATPALEFYTQGAGLNALSLAYATGVATFGAAVVITGTLTGATTVDASTGYRIGGTATTGTLLRGNGTNFVATTATFPATATSGDVLIATGSNAWGSLAIDTTAGRFLRSTGSAPAWSTLVLPNSASSGDLPYATSANVVGTLAIGGSNKVLTSSGSAPQWVTDIAYTALPTNNGSWDSGVGTTITITRALTVSGTLTGALSGNASTATALQNPRTIGGVSFDGTANITVASATGGFGISGGTLTVTIASATASSVGPNGATNPVWQVDTSTASQAAGLKLTGATAAGTVALAVISSGSNAGLTLNALGTGTIGIGSVSTGAVMITPATTITGALTQTGLATFNGGATVASGQTLTVTGATITGLTAASVGAATFPGGSYAFTGATTLTGGAGNMTVVAGTGNSRTIILQGTSGGGVATTNVTLSDTTAVFNGIALSGISTLTATGDGSLGTTAGASATTLTLGATGGTAGARRIVFGAGTGNINWRISSNDVADALTITPSTATGGGTFTSPALKILNSGSATATLVLESDLTITVGAGVTFATSEKSTTALTTPGALSATQYTAFASTVSGATIMGYGTTGDVTLKNRAGTTVLGIDSNATSVTLAGALAMSGALSGVTTLATSSTINGQTVSSAASFTGTLATAGNITATVNVNAERSVSVVNTNAVNDTTRASFVATADTVTGKVLAIQGNYVAVGTTTNHPLDLWMNGNQIARLTAALFALASGISFQYGVAAAAAVAVASTHKIACKDNTGTTYYLLASNV